MYIVDIYGGIRCDTPEEVVALVGLYVSQQRKQNDKDWRWPMHQPFFVEGS